MIQLPDFAIRGSVTPTFIDAGFTQRGVQSLSRIDRKGGRYTVACTYGPFHPEEGRVMVARLVAGKQEGIRVAFPLLHSQGAPGAVTLNGSVSTGRVIEVDGATPGYFVKEGYWLSLVKDGQHFLHSVRSGGRVNASGQVTLTLNEMLRDSFPDNAVVNLARPMVQGFVQGDTASWQYAVDRMIPIEFVIEEAR